MEFPAYVPAAVRKTISAYLEGDSDEIEEGLLAAIASKKLLLQKIEASIKNAEDAIDFIQYKSCTIKEIGMIEDRVECLLRLANDLRMRDAYALLTLEISSDDQWESFVLAAAGAYRNYGDIRERLRKARELITEIAEEVSKLSRLVEQFLNLGIANDSELELLRLPLRRTTKEIQKVSIGPTEGPIYAAMRSRQRNERTEYLRAFDNLLNEYQLTARSASFIKAITIVANVVINDPEQDVTYDDVRKVLAHRYSANQENSTKN